jgi:hypothetical protein
MADALTRTLLLDAAAGSGDGVADTTPLLEGGDGRHELHNAAGIVAERAGCDTAGALALIRARAFADSVPPLVVARRVICGELRLDRWPE